MIDDNVTELLNQWASGDASVENKLFSHIYPWLHQAARIQLNKIQPASVNPTILVNELYLKLKKSKSLHLDSRCHFLAMASRMVRQILIDVVRKNQAEKRGGAFKLVTYYDSEYSNQDTAHNSSEVIDWGLMNDLLNELDLIDSASVELIEMRFFAGLKIDEIAKIQNTSTATVSRNWKFAKSWLINRVENESGLK